MVVISPWRMPSAFVEHLRHRGEAVGRAGGVRDDPGVPRAVHLVEVDAERHGDVRLLGRRGDDDLLAPASRCFCAPARARKSPVDSIATSTPSSAQGSCAGSVWPGTGIKTPSTTIPPSAASTAPGNGP